MKRRLLALTLAVLMLFSLMPTMAMADTVPSDYWTDADNYDVSWYEGKGTSDAPKTYTLDTAEKLAGFAYIVSYEGDDQLTNDHGTFTIKGAASSFLYCTIIVSGTIDLAAHKWAPICDKNNYGCMTAFTGGESGATIENVYIDSGYYPEGGYSGFFGITEGGALTISNLTFDNVKNVVEDGSAGVVVGCASEGPLTLSNITVKNSTTSGGGIMLGNTSGYGSDVTITNCTIENCSSAAGYIASDVWANCAEDADAPISMTISGLKIKGSTAALDNTLLYYSLSGAYTEEDGWANVVSTPVCFVAEIVGGEKYFSLEAAIAAANSGDTIKLLDDLTESPNYWLVQKKLIIDLDGHTITTTSDYGFYQATTGSLTVENGTINTTGSVLYSIAGTFNAVNLTVNATNDYALYVKPSYSQYPATINIDKDSHIIASGKDAVCLYTTGGQATLNVYGEISCSAKEEHGEDTYVFSAVITNGQAQTYNANINIFEGASLVSTYGPTIYAPAKGTITVSGGLLQGNLSAIAIKSGSLIMTGGELHATGNDTTPTGGYSNGINGSGAPLQIESNTDYYGNIIINISGGKLTSDNGVAIYEYIGNGTETKVKGISVSDGMFKGGAEKSTVMISEQLAADNGFISGGYFTSDVSDFVADDYICIPLPNTYPEYNKGYHFIVVPVADLTYIKNDGTTEKTDADAWQMVPYTLASNSFTRTGYTFAGWALTPNGAVKYKDGETVTLEKDLDLYAVWGKTYTPSTPVTPPEGSTLDTNLSDGANAGVGEKADETTKAADVAKTEQLEKANVTGVAEGLKDSYVEDIIKQEVEKATETAGNKDIKVDVDVKNVIKLEKVEVKENADNEVTEIDYSVTPYATVTTTVTVDGKSDTTITDLGEVENTDLDPKAEFEVTLSCAGMTPKSVVHYNNDGTVADLFVGNAMGYDKDKKTVTVTISHFSEIKIFAVENPIPADQAIQRIAADGTILAYYESLGDALAEVDNGQTVKLFKNCNTGTEYPMPIVYFTDKTFVFTLDTNGFEFTGKIIAEPNYTMVSSDVSKNLRTYTFTKNVEEPQDPGTPGTPDTPDKPDTPDVPGGTGTGGILGFFAKLIGGWRLSNNIETVSILTVIFNAVQSFLEFLSSAFNK